MSSVISGMILSPPAASTAGDVGGLPPWQPRPEIWMLMAAVIGLGVYASRVIQPKAVAAGEAPITRSQKRWYLAGVAVLWLSTDWPVHDIAEQHLYWVHMLQHSILTVVVPPMMLLATPTWLARLLVGEGAFRRFLNFWARPIPAVIVYNFLVVFSHWAWVVNNSVTYGWVHYGIHLVLVASAFLVWMPVCGPLPELRVSPPMQIFTIFLMSIIPTIPAAFLTTAEGVIYGMYDRGTQMWGFGAVADQQLAGVMMKVITGFYLWGLMAVLFFRWTLGDRTNKRKYRGKLVVTGADGSQVLVDDDGTPSSVQAAPPPAVDAGRPVTPSGS